MSAVLPSRRSKTFWDLQLTWPVLALSTLKNGFLWRDLVLFLAIPVSQLLFSA